MLDRAAFSNLEIGQFSFKNIETAHWFHHYYEACFVKDGVCISLYH